AVARVPARTAGPKARSPLAAPPRTVYAPPSAAPTASSPSAADGSVFAAIPMGELRGETLAAFPIVSAGEGSPIKTVAARKESVPGGTDLVMETEEVVIVIERRATSYEEFFERRTI
ncbi:MAG TPA: hypothetical protein DDW67_04655, partial [Elusimicrobia bacterium]|nr:hypothetical protein [Elusimicrobiota bacterium]